MEAALDYLLPKEDGTAGSPSATAQVAVLPWNLVVLYPQGAKTDDVMFSASIRVPAGWKFATALQTVNSGPADFATFETISLTRLVDSPLLAGAFFQDLRPVPRPETRTSPEHCRRQRYRHHPEQRPARQSSPAGRRNRRSVWRAPLSPLRFHAGPNRPSAGQRPRTSRIQRQSRREKMLLDPDSLEGLMDLLPHEFFHSWNGKYRRPMDSPRLIIRSP
jgi:predicted metalloprotease with PDZ domain